MARKDGETVMLHTSPTLPSLSEPGKYLVGDELARGGMAQLFRGQLQGSEGFRRPVVIRKMLPQLAADPGAVRIFAEEARLAARLIHGHIVQCIDYGRDDSGPFIVLEYVDGPSLCGLLARARQGVGPTLPAALSCFIGCCILEALDFAHRLTNGNGRPLGCVHGDVASSKVLLSRDGQVKLTGFGSTAAATFQVTDGRSDLFSVGMLLYELLTGRALPPGANRAGVVEATRRQPIRVPALASVVGRALQRDPALAYSDADEFRQALMRATASEGEPARARDLAAFVTRFFPPEVPPLLVELTPSGDPGDVTPSGDPGDVTPSGDPARAGRGRDPAAARPLPRDGRIAGTLVARPRPSQSPAIADPDRFTFGALDRELDDPRWTFGPTLVPARVKVAPDAIGSRTGSTTRRRWSAGVLAMIVIVACLAGSYIAWL